MEHKMKRLSVVLIVLLSLVGAAALAQDPNVTFGNVHVNGTLTCVGGPAVGCGTGGGGGGSPATPFFSIQYNNSGSFGGLLLGPNQLLVGTSNAPTTLSTGTFLFASNNLSDLLSPSAARTNLGLGAVATQNIVPYTLGGTSTATGPANIILPVQNDTAPGTGTGDNLLVKLVNNGGAIAATMTTTADVG